MMWTQAYFQRSTRETLMPFPSFDWQWEPVSVIGVSLLAQPVSGGAQTWALQWAAPRGSVFWLWDKTAWCACLRANLLQSCPTLWDSMGCSPPGSSVRGISQARIWDWVAITSSRGSSWPRDWTRIFYVSCRFFTTSAPGKPKAELTVGLFHSLDWNGFILLLKIYWLLVSRGLCLFF